MLRSRLDSNKVSKQEKGKELWQPLVRKSRGFRGLKTLECQRRMFQ
jgi:hypothetical protein